MFSVGCGGYSSSFIRLNKADSPQKIEKLKALAEKAQQALEKVQQRLENRPVIEYPDNLPVSQKRDEIASAIINHQVVIVAGETTQGKPRNYRKSVLILA